MMPFILALAHLTEQECAIIERQLLHISAPHVLNCCSDTTHYISGSNDLYDYCLPFSLPAC
jgi:hypothetical protein